MRKSSVILLYLLIMVVFGQFNENSLSSRPEVWLTVSSLAGLDQKSNKPFERQIELNWKRVSAFGNDTWVGLFGEEPDNQMVATGGRNLTLEWLDIDDQSAGRHRFSEKTIRTVVCLKYWIGLVESDRVVAKNCLQIRPFWMEQNLRAIGDRRLTEVMIPGTHNSASYGRYRHKEDNLYTKYSLCQDETVFNQLVFGIRFLDLRVAYDHHEGQNYKFWIVHGPMIMQHTLDSILAQVKRFVEMAPKEVVVLDFHRLEKGFNKEIGPKLVRRHHRKLLALIARHLGQYLVAQRMAFRVPIRQLIALDKRVVIGYPITEFVANQSYVSPATKHLWANTDQTDQLVDFFDTTLCDRHDDNRLHSAMAQLTGDRIGIILNRYDGLRAMADRVNRLISDRFADQTDWSSCANVVATDYMLGNSIVDIAIAANRMRARGKP